MNLPDLTNWSDGRLKCQIFERLAFGVLPFEQWMIVFANPDFFDWPGLRCKAFTVWFPTTIDYVRGTQERATLAKESERRGIDYGKVFGLTDALGECYSDCLALYSRDEQLFLRDRRLQNVHGRLHIYTWDKQKAHFFDASTGSIEKCEIPAADYRAIMSTFYSDMQVNTLILLDRLLGSEPFDTLLSLYRTELVVEAKLLPLAEELGITGGGRSVRAGLDVRRPMRSSTRARYWMSYLPGLAISILAVLVASIMGGPIAAAILGFAAVPSLLLFCILCFFVLMKYTPAKRFHSLAMGFGLYLVSVGVTLILLNAFGPSQIM